MDSLASMKNLNLDMMTGRRVETLMSGPGPTKREATKAAKRIRKYWEEFECDVQVWIEKINGCSRFRHFWEVRSDLVNGLPRDWAGFNG